LRSGCSGCVTTANPVPLHAGHFCSVGFAAGFFILNLSGGLNRRSEIVRVKAGMIPELQLGDIGRKVMSPDSALPLLIRIHPFVGRDLLRLGQLDHVHGRGVATLLTRPAFQRRNVNLLTFVRRNLSYPVRAHVSWPQY
jgi:hypothetical protein